MQPPAGSPPPPRPAPPRLMSAALPPGYLPDEEGEPAVLTYFRIYSGLAVLSGLLMAVLGVYYMVQHRARSDGFLFWMVVAVLGTFGFFTYLLGVLSPRRPWMHVVGIVILGFGMLSGCWMINVALLIYWLKPEVKRWFDTPPDAPTPGRLTPS